MSPRKSTELRARRVESRQATMASRATALAWCLAGAVVAWFGIALWGAP